MNRASINSSNVTKKLERDLKEQKLQKKLEASKEELKQGLIQPMSVIRGDRYKRANKMTLQEYQRISKLIDHTNIQKSVTVS